MKTLTIASRRARFTWTLCATLSLQALLSCAETNSPVVWVHAYEAAILPGESKPGWIHYGDGKSTIESNTLVLSSTTAGAEYHMIRGKPGDPVWDGSQGAIIEFRMRAREKSADAVQVAEITIGNGQRYYSFTLANTNWRTYRLLLGHDQAQLFGEKDGKLVFEAGDPGKEFTESHAAEDRDYIYFGDGGGSSGGVSEWKFIRWTNKQPALPR